VTVQALAPTRVRIAWIDRLHVGVIAGVILAHTAGTYLVDVDWYYEEHTASVVSSIAFSVPVDAGVIFGLAPLFLVAGWLSSGSVRRHGAASFARARLLRLGLPTLVYLILLDPVADYLGLRASGRTTPFRTILLDPFGNRELGPMWFTAALLVVSLAYAGYRRIVPHQAQQPKPIRMAHLGLFALLIGVADFVVWLHWGYGTGTLWNLNWPHWPQSAGSFALGLVAGERGWLGQLSGRMVRLGRRALLVGLLLLLGVAAASISSPDLRSLAGGWHWQTISFAMLDGVITVGLCVWVVGIARQRWNLPLSGLTRRAARGSYATYVLHPPVLVALAWAARPLPWPAELKFVLVALVGVPLCFVVGSAVTKLRYVNRVL
jgi:glucan biosynthesis protein C